MYVKAFPLRSVDEIPKIKDEMHKNSIIILRITPLAQKNVEELRKVVEELYTYVVSLGGDIARLGDERVILTPPGVKVWRGLL
ncbi:MAG: cell division protein SepF [Thaumarchaeota archaeon]|nr:cell division protein SepF [Nitrososphaerota archaeon]